MRLVILGGSGSATPELVDALAAWPGGPERRPSLDIVLTSRSAERLGLVATEMRRRIARDGWSDVQVLTATDLDEALDGADVVLNAVRVGGLAARAFDETFPQARGIPGEETIGPGGFANALRTVPVALGLWARVIQRAPDALRINLTNPSGIIAAAVGQEFGESVFSVCDSPVTFCDAIAQRLSHEVGSVRERYVGLNHIGWWIPRAETELEATSDLANGQDPEAVRAQGALGAPYLRYYIHPERVLVAQRAAAEVRATQLQRLEAELLAGYAAESSELPRRGAVWYAIAVLPLINGWINGASGVFTIGLRNDGYLDGVADDVIVERPVCFDHPRTVTSIAAPDLPSLPAAILGRHAAYESLAAVAARPSGTRIDRVRALMANPLVTTYDLASILLDDIEARSAA
jgi:6-phospho-beta-glucosidase